MPVRRRRAPRSSWARLTDEHARVGYGACGPDTHGTQPAPHAARGKRLGLRGPHLRCRRCRCTGGLVQWSPAIQSTRLRISRRGVSCRHREPRQHALSRRARGRGQGKQPVATVGRTVDRCDGASQCRTDGTGAHCPQPTVDGSAPVLTAGSPCAVLAARTGPHRGVQRRPPFGSRVHGAARPRPGKWNCCSNPNLSPSPTQRRLFRWSH